MVTYTIKDMEILTGVKAHTIRVWEKRYGIIKPNRTDGNRRYYSEKNLRRLLNICFLYKQGYKISKIAKLSDSEVKNIITGHEAIDLSDKDMIDTLIVFVLDFDTYHLNKILTEYIDQIGLHRTMQELVFPLVDRLNIASISESVWNVHLSYFSEMVITKIHAEISAIEVKSSDSIKCILYLPKRNSQELYLHYLHYMLKVEGYNITNLGYKVSTKELKLASHKTKAKYIITILHDESMGVDKLLYIKELASAVSPSTLMITGFQTRGIISEDIKNTEVFKNVEDALNIIKAKGS